MIKLDEVVIEQVDNGFKIGLHGYTLKSDDDIREYFHSEKVFHSIEEVFAEIRSYLK